MNKQGEPYKVFTSFYKKWRPYLRIRDVYHYDLNELIDIVIASPNNLKDVQIDAGSSQAHEQEKWQQFLEHDIQNYENGREYLPEILTSQLSIALAYGLLDIIEIFNDLLSRYEEDESNYEAFIRELIFREFYYVLMTQYLSLHINLLNRNIVILIGLKMKRILKLGVMVKRDFQ